MGCWLATDHSIGAPGIALNTPGKDSIGPIVDVILEETEAYGFGVFPLPTLVVRMEDGEATKRCTSLSQQQLQ